MRRKVVVVAAGLAALVAMAMTASSGGWTPGGSPAPTPTAAGLAPDGWPMGAVPDVELAGMYTIGFEASSIDPCFEGAPGDSGPLWVMPSAGDALSRALAELPPISRAADSYETVYVRVGGDLAPYRDIHSAPHSGYGHLGASAREMSVRYVLEIARDRSCVVSAPRER